MNDLDEIDPRGRFARCPRCGWLDERTRERCAQCGDALDAAREHRSAIELRVVRASGPLHERSIADIRAIRTAIEAITPVELSHDARRAIEALDGRVVLVAPDEESAVEARQAIVAGLAQLRGELTMYSDAPLAVSHPGVVPAKSLADANVAVISRALALSRAHRDALRSVRWVIASDPAPLAKSLASLYELVAAVRPELARTRRSFLARFGAVDRASTAIEQSALGALLARVVLRVAPERALPPALAPLDRWLDAAPRG